MGRQALPACTLLAGRYELRRTLGEGGYGVVYEARDTEWDAVVALKTLSRMEPEALLRFKEEFRSLQHIEHPNLVHYEELECHDGQWFLTMELVRGCPFTDYVRPPLEDAAGRVGYRARALDEQRLRASFAQLVDGLNALHGAGRVHCDIKPSNLMVEASGRVVVLDFGLISAPDQQSDAPPDYVLGTPEYMAPEQARAEGVGPATDWYAAGSVLYEALTGRVPFRGTPMQIVLDKQKYLPRHPSEINPNAPRDLSELALALLAPDPDDRPCGEDIGAQCRPDGDARRFSRSALKSAVRPAEPPEAVGLVGRSRELGALSAAFEHVSQGTPAFVYVGGESGVGKTALVSAFTEELREFHGALVLSGRCYERETVPFKAFDGVVDDLARCLVQVPTTQCRAWLTSRAGLLAQVFPVLRQVEAVRELSVGSLARDPNTLRSQAFAALRELLGRIALSRPLVVCIDDLQWSDRDSLDLLEELLDGPDAPVCLVVAAGRPLTELSREVAQGVQALLSQPKGHHLALAGLSPEETADLAQRLSGGALSPTETHRITRDTKGHPLFVVELARYGVSGERPLPPGRRLSEALWQRIASLDPPVRAVLELLSVAGAPLSDAALAGALGVDATTVSRRLMQLRLAHLARSAGSHRSECFHDRVRRTLVDRMGPERRRAFHRALALSLSAEKHVDYEQLADQWAGAGDHETAARLQVRAAETAARALAFNRAARLYRQALEHPTAFEAARLPQLRVAYAEALSAAGFSVEAAEVFLQTAATAEGARARELSRRGAHLLLRSGKIRQGEEVADRLLREVRLSRPRTPARALGRLAWQRLRMWGWPPRSIQRMPMRSETDAYTEQRLQLLWTVAPALAWFDPLGGMALQSQYARLAITSGVTHHVIRSLAIDAVGLSMTERQPQPRTRARLDAAQALAERVGHPYLRAVCLMARGYTDSFVFRPPEALAALVEAEGILREQCVDVAWERTNTRAGLLNTLWNAGQLRRQEELGREWLRDARDRGDHYALAQLQVVGLSYSHCLVADDADAAEVNLRESLAGWPQDMYALPQWTQEIGQLLVGLYRGDGAALRTHRAMWPKVKGSQLLRTPYFALLTHLDGGWACLCAATRASGPERRALLDEARRHARKVRGTRWPLADGLAAQIRGQVAILEQDDAGAAEQLRAAYTALSQRHTIYARPTAYLLGSVLGGQEGRSLRVSAEEWAREQGIRAPQSWFAMFAPALRAR